MQFLHVVWDMKVSEAITVFSTPGEAKPRAVRYNWKSKYRSPPPEIWYEAAAREVELQQGDETPRGRSLAILGF